MMTYCTYPVYWGMTNCELVAAGVGAAFLLLAALILIWPEKK